MPRNGKNYLLLDGEIDAQLVPNKKWKNNDVYELRSSLAYQQVPNTNAFLASVVYFCLNSNGHYINPYPTEVGSQQYNEYVNNHIYYINVKQ